MTPELIKKIKSLLSTTELTAEHKATLIEAYKEIIPIGNPDIACPSCVRTCLGIISDWASKNPDYQASIAIAEPVKKTKKAPKKKAK